MSDEQDLGPAEYDDDSILDENRESVMSAVARESKQMDVLPKDDTEEPTQAQVQPQQAEVVPVEHIKINDYEDRAEDKTEPPSAVSYNEDPQTVEISNLGESAQVLDESQQQPPQTEPVQQETHPTNKESDEENKKEEYQESQQSPQNTTNQPQPAVTHHEQKVQQQREWPQASSNIEPEPERFEQPEQPVVTSSHEQARNDDEEERENEESYLNQNQREETTPTKLQDELPSEINQAYETGPEELHPRKESVEQPVAPVPYTDDGHQQPVQEGASVEPKQEEQIVQAVSAPVAEPVEEEVKKSHGCCSKKKAQEEETVAKRFEQQAEVEDCCKKDQAATEPEVCLNAKPQTVPDCCQQEPKEQKPACHMKKEVPDCCKEEDQSPRKASCCQQPPVQKEVDCQTKAKAKDANCCTEKMEEVPDCCKADTKNQPESQNNVIKPQPVVIDEWKPKDSKASVKSQEVPIEVEESHQEIKGPIKRDIAEIRSVREKPKSEQQVSRNSESCKCEVM